MDATEFGAYVRLFLTCYKTSDHTLPNEDDRLARIAHCNIGVWNRIKKTILEKFIVVTDAVGGEHLVHEGVFSEIIRYSAKSKKNKANRLKGLEMEQPVVNQSSTNGQPNADNLRTKNKEQGKEEDISPLEAEMMFTSIWEAYPGRGKHGARGKAYNGSRQTAFKSFQKILKKEKNHGKLVADILSGVYLYTDHLDRSGYTSAHLSTWLNNDRWKDDYSSEGGDLLGDNIHARALAEGVRGIMQFDGEPDYDEHGEIQPVPTDK